MQPVPSAQNAGRDGRDDNAIEARGVGKRFGATWVLRDINVDIRRGTIHALIGENGAGKSTLGKIIGGVHSADAGELKVFGEVVGRWDPRRALAKGVAVIQQELSLVPELSVAQNVFLGVEEHRAWYLRSGLDRRLREFASAAGFDLDPAAKVGRLRIAEQQVVEILRALARQAEVIVMDEPTSALTADEAEKLHAAMHRLAGQGKTILYVTHFLDAVLEHADEVTVLRDGDLVQTTPTASQTKAVLVEAMLGHPADITFPPKPPPPGPDAPCVLSVRDLETETGVRGVSFDIAAGEILGLAGLVGAGRSEIARAVYGVDPVVGGTVHLHGEPIRRLSPRRSLRNGMAMVPEDRRHQGLVLTQRVRPNLTLARLDKVSWRSILNLTRERSEVAAVLDRFGIVPADPEYDIVNYSGGNQQKVLLSKFLFADPSLLILDEPTRGIDIGAKARIYEFTVDVVKAGVAVLLISSELEEVVGLTHRILAVRDGEVVHESASEDTSVGELLHLLFGDAAAGQREFDPEPVS